MTLFFTIFLIALSGLCLFLGWIAWPRRKKKVDTSKVDKEIDELLNFDVTDKIYD